MAALPSTMKAWIVSGNGEPRAALVLAHQYPVPLSPRASNLIIKVSYAALNPADLNFIANLPNWLPFRHNPIPGLDFCGTVVKMGSSVPSSLGVSVGTEVCGALNVCSVVIGRGSLAEYIEVPAAKVAVKPTSLKASDAAGGLGVAGQTAFIVLREANLKPGERVLINGASGGVGSILVQVAKRKGATVYGVCSRANAELVKRLGADEVIDYQSLDSLPGYLTDTFALAEGKALDKVLDCVGDEMLFRKSATYLHPKGVCINIVGGLGLKALVASKLLPVALGGTPRNYKLLGLFPDGAIAKEVSKWVEEGALKEFLTDSEYPMEDAVRGYERVASKRSKGKVIIKISH